MLYKLLNNLFGHDYIHYVYGCSCGIARVHVDALNKPYYWYCKMTKALVNIEHEKDVTWLTCLPSKYLETK